MKVLAKSLNFVVSPNKIPTKESQNQNQRKPELAEAGLMRNQVVGILQNSKSPKPNMSKDEIKALNSLKNNKDIVILPADKGKAVVVIDKVDYVTECEKLLVDKETYTPIGPNNPTKTLKGRLQRKLRSMKKEGHLDHWMYDKIYSTSDATPRFYATPKIHNDPIKMRPIVAGINSITYNLARHLED